VNANAINILISLEDINNSSSIQSLAQVKTERLTDAVCCSMERKDSFVTPWWRARGQRDAK
jgi:hypothetical protein